MIGYFYAYYFLVTVIEVYSNQVFTGGLRSIENNPFSDSRDKNTDIDWKSLRLICKSCTEIVHFSPEWSAEILFEI